MEANESKMDLFLEVRKELTMKTEETANVLYAGEPPEYALQEVAGKIRFSNARTLTGAAAGDFTVRAGDGICWCDCSCTCDTTCSCSCSCDCSCICACSCDCAESRSEVTYYANGDCDCDCSPPVDCDCAPPVDCACAPPVDCACAPPVDCACAPPVDCACTPPVDCACSPPDFSIRWRGDESEPVLQARFGDIEFILDQLSARESAGGSLAHA